MLGTRVSVNKYPLEGTMRNIVQHCSRLLRSQTVKVCFMSLQIDTLLRTHMSGG